MTRQGTRQQATDHASQAHAAAAAAAGAAAVAAQRQQQQQRASVTQAAATLLLGGGVGGGGGGAGALGGARAGHGLAVGARDGRSQGGGGDDGGMSLLVSLDGLSPLALSEKASDLEARVQALMAAEAQELIRGQALRIIGPGAAAPHMQALAGGQGHTSTRNALSEAEEAGD